MQNNAYLVLGLQEGATEEEVKVAYETLRAKYSEERFQPGEEGNRAAAKLEEIEEAYSDIMADLSKKKVASEYGSVFGQIENLLKQGNLDEAQKKLDECVERGAEWHYLQSIVFYKKNWYAESKKQLEFAVSMDPNNTKYKDALIKLNNLMNGPQANANTNTNQNQYNNYNNVNANQERQMGGGCAEGNCCLNLLCADCCCESMGFDLIPCC